MNDISELQNDLNLGVVIYSICVATSLPDFHQNYNVIYDATINLFWSYFASHDRWLTNSVIYLNWPDTILLLESSSWIVNSQIFHVKDLL